MGTSGYVAYRHEKKYYRQYLYRDAYPLKPGVGQHLVNTIPRTPAAFKKWMTKRIQMLKRAQTFHDNDPKGDPEYAWKGSLSAGADKPGYTVTYANDWTYGRELWSYVIDFDNLAFTVNGIRHFRLDNLPRDLSVCYDDNHYERDVPEEYLCDPGQVDLWPLAQFDTEACLAKYRALESIVVPATEWGIPTWEDLSVSQQFSIELGLDYIDNHSFIFVYGFRSDQPEMVQFCWNALCASVPALPIFEPDRWRLPVQTLVSGFNEHTWPGHRGTPPSFRLDHDPPNDRNYLFFPDGSCLLFRKPYYMDPSKDSDKGYFWVRGCLVTFCVQLVESVYVAYEVEHMVQKMRQSPKVTAESVGIILSSQHQIVVVALDGPRVRHSPVLDIGAMDGKPGRASEGRLLLTRLLSPVSCAGQSRKLSTAPKSIDDLPLEVLRMIIEYTDVSVYLVLWRVSKSIRSVCVANPRVDAYTVLYKVPGPEMRFAARSTDDGVVKTVQLDWEDLSYKYYEQGQWRVREVSSEELEERKEKKSVPDT
ncbi:unnamed protein product [Rhizoctonia solani]|uniref:F-box domain-containing protein n=1 Tax=Rhizoctonia solani TaxID=456999 RepID=A0A8H3HM69_9AGAM|nr:unnamed protein product [Rhizoctonia solani]